MSDLSRDEHLQTMRLMAWERAKGELNSIGHASYANNDPIKNKNIHRYFTLLAVFIAAVEDEALID